MMIWLDWLLIGFALGFAVAMLIIHLKLRKMLRHQIQSLTAEVIELQETEIGREILSQLPPDFFPKGFKIPTGGYHD